ncbi:MAG: ABC transporter ATP-binding protein [Candidatus Obscuribacterales bacterium]|nr:ABC transporter ATP-binding protein [Candidatus Obscuribacterales bacterium]
MFENIVEVRNLRKEFAADAVAVKDISFCVNKGEIFGLLGPNGAGKTTTIHMMLGLTRPSSGSIKIFGKDIEKDRVEILQRCNFASAYVYLPWNLKVWENLFIFSEIYGIKNRKEKIEYLLELFEIENLRNKITGTLSAGEQTRLNLCKAFLNDPELLLLDEPTASLDPDLADKVRKILKQLQKERSITVINTSHNMLDVSELCERILFVQHGNVIAEGRAEELMAKFGGASLEEVFITIARSSRLEGALGK